MKVAIVVGHNSKAKGANALGSLVEGESVISEWDFNKRVAQAMVDRVTPNGTELKIFYRPPVNGYSKEIAAAYGELEKWGAQISVELHFNDSTPPASGCEMLTSGSTYSRLLAEHFHKTVVRAFDFKGIANRGVKKLLSNENGYGALHASSAWAIITEPFFGKHPSDFQKAKQLGVNGLADLYLQALASFLADPKVNLPKPVLTSVGADDLLLVQTNLVANGLTKEEFFTRNATKLKELVDLVNIQLANASHGESFSPLTMLDAVAVSYAEMGLNSSGKLDHRHTHSEGERGIFPLPSNIRFWNGQSSPLSTELVPVERNTKEWLLYLAHLKNRDVWHSFPGGQLYRDLFTLPGVASDQHAQMHLLAASVHGWFDRGRYPAEGIPYNSILGVTAVSTLDPAAVVAALQAAGYTHGKTEKGRKLLQNRVKNLQEGSSLWSRLYDS